MKGPAWTVGGDQGGEYFGSAVASAGDVNGDGFSDVIVGSHNHQNGQSYEGRALLFLGSAAGLATSPSWSAEGELASALFGYAVGTAGDVNGDGYSDVIVGAYGHATVGRAYVYHGSANGLSSAPDWIVEGTQAHSFFAGSVATAGDVNGDGYSDVIVGAQYHKNPLSFPNSIPGRAFVYLGSPAGLATSPAWIGTTGRPRAQLGSSVATAGDVNGDGYDDVIVGARGYSNGEHDEGAALVYMGSATGLASTPTWIAEGGSEDAYLGYAVAPGGDVNGDGYADVIVGAYGLSNGEFYEGRALVYLGSAAGLAASPAWSAEGNVERDRFGAAVATAGDVDGDGYGDVIVSGDSPDTTQAGRASVYLGSATGLAQAPAWTGHGTHVGDYYGGSIATAGDVNGDGRSDLVIGAPSYGAAGRAYAYHGSARGLTAGPAWTADGPSEYGGFGNAVAGAGDVNGDGFGDVVVGAYYHSGDQMNEGGAFAFLGSESGLAATPAWSVEGDQSSSYFGSSVAGAGDVDGDGYGDVLVGGYYSSNGEYNEGRAFLYRGSAAGLEPNASWTAEGNQAGAAFAYSVASAGDVNGDGYADVIIGSRHQTNGQQGEGAAFVYLGSAAGLAASPAWSAEGNQVSASFGWSVASAGDVNGDGFSDVLVGAPELNNGQRDEGRAYLYLGSAAGLATSPAWRVESNQVDAYLGNSVASAGDVNGDGYSDVLVGAYLFAHQFSGQGRAFLYLGSPAGLAATPAWTADGDEAGDIFGQVSSAGDVNGDGFSDVLVGAYGYGRGGRVFGYLGSAAGLATSPSWSAGSGQRDASFGFALASAGDVNGDGHGDAIMGAYGFDAVESNEGRAFVYLGNGGNGSPVQALQQRAKTDQRPIALLGRIGFDSLFRIQLRFRGDLAGFAWANGAAPRARLEWEVKPLGVPFDEKDVERGKSVALVPGGEVTFNELVQAGNLRGPASFRWRARVATDNPLLPHTPWFSLPGNNVTESKLRRP